MYLRTTDTQAVLDKLFGKTIEEQLKHFSYFARVYKHINFKEHPFTITTKEIPEHGTCVSIGFKGIVNVIAFYLLQYPAYCGSRLFHTFYVKEDCVTQEQVDEIMNAFFNENKWDGNRLPSTPWENPANGTSQALGRANRIEVIMVEQRNLVGTRTGYPDVMVEYEPVENPSIQYKMLWNFFHKYGKRVRTRLEVNPNSGNLLHNMEVIF